MKYILHILPFLSVLSLNPLFLFKIKKNNNIMIVKSNKTHSSGLDERYSSLQNNTEFNFNLKSKFYKNLEYIYLLYMLQDEQIYIHSKLQILENYKLFDFLNYKNINYNISSGGLLKSWDFDFD